MKVQIKPEQLQSVVQQMLHDIPQKCDNAIEKAEKTVSKKAVKTLQATSPEGDGPKALQDEKNRLEAMGRSSPGRVTGI